MKSTVGSTFWLILGNISYTLAGYARNNQNYGPFDSKYVLSAGIIGQNDPIKDTTYGDVDDGTVAFGESTESGSENDHVPILDPSYIKRVELELKMTYGEHEVTYFRNMIDEFSKSIDNENMHPLVDDVTEDHMKEHFEDKYVKDYKALDDQSVRSNDLRTARIVVKLIKNEFAKFEKIQKKYLEPNIERFTQIKAIADSFGKNTDTPCKTEAGCRRLEMLINMCTYIRGGTQFAYDIFATMVHVLGSMLSVLCGCVFIGPIHVCFLKNFPYTCRIPYPVFTSLFQGTTSVWQLVKTTTSICRIYADPGFGSKFG